MSKREKSIQDRTVIAIVLAWPDAWVRVKHGTVFGHVGDPDVYGCVPDPLGGTARFFGFEVKNEDGEPTGIQLHCLRKLAQAGAICGLISDPSEAIDLIREGLTPRKGL